MKKIFTSSFLTLLAASLMAQTVSVDEAQKKAEAFLKQSAGTRAQQSLNLSYISAQGDETYYYVFNKGNNQGFIIMGGDKAAQEILGYSDKGTFDYDKIPDNMRWWLGQYDLQISHAIREVKAGRLVVSKEVKTRAGSKSDVEPLLKTTWDQDAPYNSQIPTYLLDNVIGEAALATGCVATAGAQVMKYYNYPTTGVGSNTLKTVYNGHTFSADFENTTYEWDKMENSYEEDTYTGTASEIAVGTLLYHVGVAANMDYGQLNNGGSGTGTSSLGWALVNNFKYDKGMVYEKRQNYTDEVWEDMVYEELQAGRPVIYDGDKRQANGTTSGHCFVCDGYKASDNTFYINWGWGGLSNTSYKLTGTGALLPAHQGAGSGDGSINSYTINQAALFGVQPDQGGTPIINMAKNCDFVLSVVTISAGNSVTISANDPEKPFCVNHSCSVTDITMGFRLKNSSNEYDIPVGKQDYPINVGPMSLEFTIPGSVEADTYQVIPIYVNTAGEWQEVKGDYSACPTLTVTEADGVALYEPIVVKNNGYASSEDLNVTFSIKNFSDETISKHYILWIFPAGGGGNVDYFDFGTIALAGDEEKEFDLSYSGLRYGNKMTAGSDYFMQLENNTDDKYLSDQVDLFFRNANPISYELTAAGWGTICLPYEAEVPAELNAFSVTGANGGELVLNPVTELEMNKPYLLQGAEGTYDFTGPKTPVGTFNNGLLTGCTEYDVFCAPQGSYVLQNQAGKGVGFFKVREDGKQTVKKYHAFLNITSSADCFSLGDGGDGSTSLEQINSLDAQSVKAYDMFGHPVDPKTKGMVIINGVKRINL